MAKIMVSTRQTNDETKQDTGPAAGKKRGLHSGQKSFLEK